MIIVLNVMVIIVVMFMVVMFNICVMVVFQLCKCSVVMAMRNCTVGKTYPVAQQEKQRYDNPLKLDVAKL